MWEELAITGGKTVLDFVQPHGPYALQEGGYVPLLPPRRPVGGLGGQGPYETAVEPIRLYARGASPAAALASAQALLETVERAPLIDGQHLPSGGATSPIRLRARAICGASAYDALIIGITAEPLVLAATPHQDFGWVVPVTLTVERRAEWRLPEEQGASSPAAAQPALQGVTFTGADATESPAAVKWSWNLAQPTVSGPVAMCMLWGETTMLALQTSPTALGAAYLPATGWSSVADAAANNPPANVLRYTASGTAEAPTALDPLTGGSNPLQAFWSMTRPLILVVCRANSATGAFLVRAESGSGGGNTVRTRMTPVPYNSGQPQILALGVLSGGFTAGLRLVAQATNAAGSPTLDISQIAIIDTANPLSRVIWAETAGAAGASPAQGYGPRAYEADPVDYGVSAMVGAYNAELRFEAPLARYAGDAFVTVGSTQITPTQADMAGLLLAVHTQYWRLTRSGPNPITVTLEAWRRRSFRVPQ